MLVNVSRCFLLSTSSLFLTRNICTSKVSDHRPIAHKKPRCYSWKQLCLSYPRVFTHVFRDTHFSWSSSVRLTAAYPLSWQSERFRSSPEVGPGPAIIKIFSKYERVYTITTTLINIFHISICLETVLQTISIIYLKIQLLRSHSRSPYHSQNQSQALHHYSSARCSMITVSSHLRFSLSIKYSSFSLKSGSSIY